MPQSVRAHVVGYSRFFRHAFLTSLCLAGAWLPASIGLGQDAPKKPENDPVAAGHSYHGESFNEGPRYGAYLMPNMGNVKFKVTTSSPLAQQFINQGVAQLHGFWYFEAERSFRQALAIDPACAIGYWGMAMSNINNHGRARPFIAKAQERKDKASRREQLYIESLANYLEDDSSKPEGERKKRDQRSRQYIKDLENILLEFPDDIEAKAFLCLRLWEGEREELPISSHLAIDALLTEIFAANPNHPAHHYRIHLWDGKKPEKALTSAALAGASLPGVAHMWHMPGHTYSKLHRYHDAVYQQEASARVDHAHMIRDRVIPDQIHNFAHNNEWLIRNLQFVGRGDDAFSLAVNMISLPRHPKYNGAGQWGSSMYGRQRLLQVLQSYRMWDRAIAICDSVFVEPGENLDDQLSRLRMLGSAQFQLKRNEEGEKTLASLVAKQTSLTAEIDILSEVPPAPKDSPAANDAQKKLIDDFNKWQNDRNNKKKTLEDERKKYEEAIALLKAHRAASKGDMAEATTELAKAGQVDSLLECEWLVAAGKGEDGLKKIEKLVKDKPGEALPLAVASYLYHSQGKKDLAKSSMEELRKISFNLSLKHPLFARLEPLANELGWGANWILPYAAPADIGPRPALDLLGPFRWTPAPAPEWVVESSKGELVSLKQKRGKPLLVVFYLGFGCLHCVEQLHKLDPKLEEFKKLDTEVIAISSEEGESLRKAIATQEKPISIALHCDPSLRVFRDYRCFDDFEQQPLHGTFLISPEGDILWQDIGYEPFMDVDFLIKETDRQLKIQRETISLGITQ